MPGRSGEKWIDHPRVGAANPGMDILFIDWLPVALRPDALRHTAGMAYDVELADRLRDILAAEPDVTEKRMFGGLAFMVVGHMALAATSGGLMLRVDPDESEALLLDPNATRMVMQGRELAGWLLIDLDAAASDNDLSRWVDLGVDYAHSLPPK